MASNSSIAPGKGSENLFLLPMELSFGERLTNFVRHFVVELESTLQLHYDILEGNINKSGLMPKVIETTIGLFANHYIGKGADKVVKLFQTPLKKPFEVIEKNKSLEYYQIVYSFQQSKEKGRQLFVDIAIDVFACFEFQFAGITSKRGDQKAIQRVARDAAQRFLNAFKSKEEPNRYSSIFNKFEKGWIKFRELITPKLPVEKIGYEMNALKAVAGRSKPKSELIPDEIWKPGFDISFKCIKCHAQCQNKIIRDWNTCHLFEKVGVAEKSISSDEYKVYSTSKSDCDKYGYRLPFPDEKLNESNVSKMCENTCMHPEVLKSSEFYKSKREIAFKLINDDDQVRIQRRILILAEEIKTDFVQFKDTHKNENRDLLMTIDTFNAELTKIITRHHNDILKQFTTAEAHRNLIAIQNKALLQLNKREIVSQMTEVFASQFKDLKETFRKKTVKIERVLFRVKSPAISFEGRIKELGKLHQALGNKITAVISQTASIVGLGGIGKTELANKYIEGYMEYYHNIVFINAEKSETISESFKTLAKKIGIKLISNDARERDIADVVEDIYRNLINGGITLVVFDNVEEYKDIKSFIFENNSKNSNHVCTLITSRYKIWDIGDKGVIKVIELNIFTEDEAMNYLRKSLENENDDDLKTLMTMLERFPLGLKQAVGYIKQESQKSNTMKNCKSFNVQDYVYLYKEKWKEVFQKGFGIDDDLYEKTITTTSRVTMQKIVEFGECGKLALSVLNIMAYLASDNIDIEEIFSKLEEDIDKLYEAVYLLHGYSMINNEKGIVSVHRLVQKAIQIYLIEMKDEENTLSEALKLLKCSDFEEHVVSVWEHSSNYPQIVKSNYNHTEYGPFEKTPIELFITYRYDTAAIRRILRHVKCDLNTYMHIACQYSNYEVFRFLIEKGADVNYKNRNNEASLHQAALGGNVKILRLLINKGLDVNVSEKHGNTPLIFATNYNRTEAIKFLLKSGANPNAINSRGKTVLHNLAFNDAVEEFNFFLSQGVDPNIRDKKYRSPLHFAAMVGSVNILQLLIDKGFDVNMADTYGSTPLLYAAIYNRTEAFKFLLKSGANPNTINAKGKTILYQIADNNAVEEFKLLLSEGLDPNIQDINGRSALHWGAIGGSVNILQLLIDKGLDVNMVDKNGDTPLHCAAEENVTKSISFLVKSGANPNAMNSKGKTVLHNIAYNDAVENFKLLLSEGANLYIRDKNNHSALHWAAMGGSVNILQLLIDKGFDVNMTGKDGETPLFCAVKKNRAEALKFLLKSGANPNAMSKSNCTPLHFASAGNNLEAATVLIEEGAEINTRNKLGRSALHYASTKCHSKIMRLLLENGAKVNVFDSNGRTPLHNLLCSGKFEDLKLLLKYDADPRNLDKAGHSLLHMAVVHFKYQAVVYVIRNTAGIDVNGRDVEDKTPLHLAAEYGRVSIVSLLVRNGGDVSAMDRNGNTPLEVANKFNRAKVMNFFN
ncbi:uncharacterized protein LOC143919248 [Arctopsyche grandis]|uniref:uncharacterized protein LOC143919248 n=1 Tax=Arctopsyche grandis TaxID=121162 RepID=UPI00406D91B2